MLFSSVASEPSLNEVIFSGAGGRVSVEVSDYERSGTPDFHDANWLIASVSISAGSFSGSFAISIGTYDLVELHRQLRLALDALVGTVSFENMETDLALTVEFQGNGKARIAGEARPHSSPAGTLAFAFDSDQSYLALTLEQLSAILRRFPVKK
jgi:hypothetical protein